MTQRKECPNLAGGSPHRASRPAASSRSGEHSPATGCPPGKSMERQPQTGDMGTPQHESPEQRKTSPTLPAPELPGQGDLFGGLLRHLQAEICWLPLYLDAAPWKRRHLYLPLEMRTSPVTLNSSVSQNTLHSQLILSPAHTQIMLSYSEGSDTPVRFHRWETQTETKRLAPSPKVKPVTVLRLESKYFS